MNAHRKKPKPSFVAASTPAGRDGTNGDDSDADFFVGNDDVEEEQTEYPEIIEDLGSSGPKNKSWKRCLQCRTLLLCLWMPLVIH